MTPFILSLPHLGSAGEEASEEEDDPVEEAEEAPVALLPPPTRLRRPKGTLRLWLTPPRLEEDDALPDWRRSWWASAAFCCGVAAGMEERGVLGGEDGVSGKLDGPEVGAGGAANGIFFLK